MRGVETNYLARPDLVEQVDSFVARGCRREYIYDPKIVGVVKAAHFIK